MATFASEPPSSLRLASFPGDVLDVDLIFAHLNLVIGDDVGVGTGVTQRVLVGLVDVVDQAFVQGPGVNLAFPVVDDGVAEAEYFALQVGYARGDPGGTGRFQGFVVRVGEEGVDCGLQGFAVDSASL